jgi:hypothetical protein
MTAHHHVHHHRDKTIRMGIDPDAATLSLWLLRDVRAVHRKDSDAIHHHFLHHSNHPDQRQKIFDSMPEL